MTRNNWLLVLFGCYLIGIPVFGAIYFYLYRKKSSRFVFASHMRDSRLLDLKAAAEKQIVTLDLLKAYWTVFTADRGRNVARVEDDVTRFTADLEDGRRIVIERHVQHAGPHGGEMELLPHVELWRSDGRLEWSGKIGGHGFLSDYVMIEEFVENVAAGLDNDIFQAHQKRQQLEHDGAHIWGFTDFLYFSTITQSTVGYGDILPNDASIRAVVICQIVFAYAILIVGLNVILTPQS